MLTYEKYREIAQTGDLVGFSGTGLLSTGIKIFSGSEWSHIGFVIKSAEWDMILCWESTLLCKVADIETGYVKKGVMLVPLEARISTYEGKVGIRRIHETLTLEQLVILRTFRQEVKNRPYEKDYCELIKSAYDGPFGKNTHDLTSIFCSEGVAEPFIRMSILPNDQSSNEYTPGDLLDEGNYNNIWEPVEEIIVSG